MIGEGSNKISFGVCCVVKYTFMKIVHEKFLFRWYIITVWIVLIVIKELQ